MEGAGRGIQLPDIREVRDGRIMSLFIEITRAFNFTKISYNTWPYKVAKPYFYIPSVHGIYRLTRRQK